MHSNFTKYCKQIVKNAKTLADSLLNLDYKLISGGTDTHLILVDLSNKSISGKKAEIVLEKAGITTNKNMIPFDEKSPMITSGIRIGTPALTSRGMKEDEMKQIAFLIDKVIQNIDDEKTISTTREKVSELCLQFPIYKELPIHEMS